MGNCFPTTIVPAPPKLTRRYSEDATIDAYSSEFRVADIRASDLEHVSYPLEELQRFLDSEWVRDLELMRGNYSIDNFALMLVGKERQWLASAKPAVSSTFGLAIGEIELESDFFPANRIMNCFLDPQGKVWLINPIDKKLFRPSEGTVIKQIIL